MAMTVPSLPTIATEVLLLFQVTFLLEALAGRTLAFSFSVLPGSIEAVVLSSVTPVTGMAIVVMAQVAVWLPSSVVTVMVVLPPDRAVTVPLATVAAVGLLLVHVTFLLVALVGCTVAVRVSVLPTMSMAEF